MNDEYYKRYNTYQKIITNDEMVEPLAARTPTAPQVVQTDVKIKKGFL